MTKRIQQSKRYRQMFAIKLALGAASVFGFSLAAPDHAMAQSVTYSGQLNIPYGRTYRDENTPYNPSSRDANGNRVIINGRMFAGDGSSLSGGLGSGFFGGQNSFGSQTGFGGAGAAGAGAIGNQLNVLTVGNYNTVIIDSTQINNGNQTVNLDGASGGYNPPIADNAPNTGELNGEINFND
ncbi:hypothetical protein MNBD_ALPHA06-1748 [hydrothermal vent metagenome]|uniref:Holdfast attachment protein HfaA n=1 Tax=hydrothermal vent metagenome TaxID=652676 RepID=A0A3B0RL36_9ZZZZ